MKLRSLTRITYVIVLINQNFTGNNIIFIHLSYNRLLCASDSRNNSRSKDDNKNVQVFIEMPRKIGQLKPNKSTGDDFIKSRNQKIIYSDF